MPSAVETCCCGASVSLQSSLFSMLQPELERFRAAHLVCRESAPADQDDIVSEPMSASSFTKMDDPYKPKPCEVCGSTTADHDAVAHRSFRESLGWAG